MKKTKHKLIVLLCMVVMQSTILWAQSGTQSFLFLDLPYSAKHAALGGGGVSLYDDNLSLALYNPATLSEKTHNMLSLNYANYLKDVNMGAVTYARTIGETKNHIAFGVNFLDYGKFQRVSEEDLILGTFSAKDIALNLLYARDIAPCLSAGVNLKPFFSFYDRYHTAGMAFDIGINLHLEKANFNAALVARNIGWQFGGFHSKDGVTEHETLPFDLQLGLSEKLPHAPFRFSLTLHHLQRFRLDYERAVTGSSLNDDTQEIKVGDMLFRHTIWTVEILPTSYLHFAISYNHRRHAEMRVTGIKSMAGFSAGAGINIRNISVDFGVASYQVGSMSYNVSVAFGMNDWGVK
ncbi:MAG: type IX secretion system protein PorQ [Bacteroidales bacterium]|nr:type IX secretion system protein PorQ [Bacteroidales bacterium]